MPDTPTALFLAFQEAVAGRFSLDREIGRGGMGVVYLAREVRLDRLVAIKLLPPQFADQPALRERFLREARTAARLSHPNIVPIHTVDEAGAFVFYVMTYVEGETLSQRVTRGALAATDVMRVLREVAWALGYAHDQGVVHRDVKPANILLDRASGRAMVTDFGIARVLDSSTSQTMVGEMLGTPEYMSPEQASGENIDGRSDLYSLGLVGYFAITGTVPFTGSTQAVLAQQITRDAPSVSSAARGVPRQLADAIDRCLLKDSSRRFASGAELADALAPTLGSRTDIPAPLRVFIERRRNAGLLGLPIAAVGFGASVLLGNNRPSIVLLSSTIIALGVGVPIAIVYQRLRNLARVGYGPSDIAVALRRDFERKREEFLYDYGPTVSGRERVIRLMSLLLIVTGLSAAANLYMMARGIFPPNPGQSGLMQPLLVFGAWGLGLTALTRRWKRFRENGQPPMGKFWDGAVGRLLGRLAAWKLRGKTVATERATEAAIAMSADDMFGALPKEMRRQLGDVPAVINTLRQRATSAREQLASLDESIAMAQRTSVRESTKAKQEDVLGDLREARQRADTRMSDVVTALETIRLDLLRLQAGVGSVEHITLDLAAAEEVGREADRLVAGRREVEDAVRRRDG